MIMLASANLTRLRAGYSVTRTVHHSDAELPIVRDRNGGCRRRRRMQQRMAQNDYSELFSQGSGSWTVGPFTSGSPSNGAASATLLSRFRLFESALFFVYSEIDSSRSLCRRIM